MKNKKTIYVLLSIVLIVLLIVGYKILTKDDLKKEKSNMEDKEKQEEIYNLEVLINNKSYDAVLENNETVKELLKLMPLQVEMTDLNNNEKYFYMDKSIKASNNYTGKISKGDIMLYGDDCLVIFYKSFNTSYHYTKIGHITDLEELDNSNVSVEFKII